MERQQNPFDTPVPGQSLTDIPKNYKWENPARFSKLEDSSLHIWKELNKKDNLKRIIILLEAGISVEYKSRGYIPSKKTMKKAKKAAEEKPRGLMSRAKEDK